MSLRATLIAALALAALAPAATAATVPARVTFVGDSVPAAMSYTPAARSLLGRRLHLPSCPYQGATPPTALQAVRALGRSVGDVLVVDVGYNDTGATYGRGMRRVVRAARAQGARAVVWVTLRQAGTYRGEYVRANTAIRTEAARWGGRVVLADWNAFSARATFFSQDGLHLSGAGAMSLARFLRAPILQAARIGP